MANVFLVGTALLACVAHGAKEMEGEHVLRLQRDGSD